MTSTVVPCPASHTIPGSLTAGVAEEHADVVGGLAVGARRPRLRGELHQEAEQHVCRRQAIAVLQYGGLAAAAAGGPASGAGRSVGTA